MTLHCNIKELKTIAKRIARSKRIQQSGALDLVAQEIGFSHWYEASVANKNGWVPSPEQISQARNLYERINPEAISNDDDPDKVSVMFGDPGGEDRGHIGVHPYRIDVSLDDVFISGSGWLIRVGEAPLSKPVLEVTDRRYKNNPIHDPDFVSQALKIANIKADQVRARIASDWPRRSTKPDTQGRALHPIHEELSDKWYCLHCDSISRATEVAGNLWHCPSCGASPIDIFSSPWWLETLPDAAKSSK